MKFPPTLLPSYKEKSQNNKARVLAQQAKPKEIPGWNSGVLDSATESPDHKWASSSLLSHLRTFPDDPFQD